MGVVDSELDGGMLSCPRCCTFDRSCQAINGGKLYIARLILRGGGTVNRTVSEGYRPRVELSPHSMPSVFHGACRNYVGPAHTFQQRRRVGHGLTDFSSIPLTAGALPIVPAGEAVWMSTPTVPL